MKRRWEEKEGDPSCHSDASGVSVAMTQPPEKDRPSNCKAYRLRGATLLSPLFLPPSLKHWQSVKDWLVSVI